MKLTSSIFTFKVNSKTIISYNVFLLFPQGFLFTLYGCDSSSNQKEGYVTTLVLLAYIVLTCYLINIRPSVYLILIKSHLV